MAITSMRLRRLITTVGVIAALLLGFGTIKAAAAWTAASAPLTIAPTSISTLQSQLETEQARSADLQDQLRSLASQSTDLTVALEAAQVRIAADADQASQLAKDLKTAKKKLAKLQATIRATQAAAARQTKTVRATAAPTQRSGDDDGGEREDDDDH
jgi:chromosome segregation ATPase